MKSEEDIRITLKILEGFSTKPDAQVALRWVLADWPDEGKRGSQGEKPQVSPLANTGKKESGS